MQVSDVNWYGLGATPSGQDGSYTVSGLHSGNYRVCFHGPPGYRYECYNDKTTQDVGDLVAVTLPGLTSGIDAVLDPGGSISGIVTKSEGGPFAEVFVQVFYPNGMWASGVRTNQNGEYSAYGLAAGNYKVFFSPPSGSGYSGEWYNNKLDQEAADLVPVVVPGVTSGIDAVLARGGSISGKVRNGANAGIANAQVQVYDSADTNMNTPRVTVTTDSERELHRPRPADRILQAVLLGGRIFQRVVQ